MSFEEQAVILDCAGSPMVGVIALPRMPHPLGVVVIIGGPQYRAGSHRQFVLLARHLAHHGYPVLRFDYRGMGDSDGETRTFEHIDDDIRCAVDTLLATAPAVRSVVLWGLCDAASAAMRYAAGDKRVVGLVLVNPWARGEQTLAKTQLKHYYTSRLLSWSFWRKLASGRVRLGESGRSLARVAGAAAQEHAVQRDYREAMRIGLERFAGSVLLILSGKDLTAREFTEYADSDPRWRPLLAGARTEIVHLPSADHTLSDSEARHAAEERTLNALQRMCLS